MRRALILLVLLAPAGASMQATQPLARFRALCARPGLVRVSVYGASHTAPDVMTGRLRERLQARCGDGGPGWVMPARPFAFYDHLRAGWGGSGWRGLAARGRAPVLEDYGLAGIALDGRPGARATLRPRGAIARASIHGWRQRGGGTLVVRAGAEERRIDTAGEGVFIEELTTEARRIRLTVEGGPVRLFGVAMEARRGVVVDNFGVPGARVRDQLRWRERSLAASVAARPPDVWVLAYGTNESIDGRVPIDRYRERLRQVVGRWKRRAPRAECLLVGPGDWPRERRDGTLRRRPRLEQIVLAQRAEAAAAGCAFFDTLAWMGGPLSMGRWMDEGLALGDRVHFTDEGYRRLGDAIADRFIGARTR